MSDAFVPRKRPSSLVTVSMFVLGTAIAIAASQGVRSYGLQHNWTPANVQDAANAAFLAPFLLASMWRGFMFRPRLLVPLYAVTVLTLTLILHVAHTTLAVLKN